MKTVYSEKHLLRQSKTELSGGELVLPFECPERMDHILAELAQRDIGSIIAAEDFDMTVVHAVHDVAYTGFLATAWEQWHAQGNAGEAIPTIWPARSLRSDKIPTDIVAQLGYYSLAAETSISNGTWDAVLAAKDVALTATDCVLKGDQAAFALCRPPGHHAARNQYGGYCFLNNAAIAAQRVRDSGVARVAILDVDFHHGNGTQDIFYNRNDVLTISLHGDPDVTFPYFLGYEDEIGRDEGVGFHCNYPMPPGTTYDKWKLALKDALVKIKDFEADVLIVSLGVDTFENDPISSFKLRSDDFLDYGASIASLDIPTVFIMEGGYAVREIGTNTVNVLDGFLHR